jgi:hypothetical protein
MIALLAAILALAGAPATSTITCDPAFVATLDTAGLAEPSTDRAWVGQDGCRALLSSSLTSREYVRVEHMNKVSLGWYQGRGLLVLLHEARHLSGEFNECRTERFAYAHVGELIDRFVPARERPFARQAAYMLHGTTLERSAYRDGC